MTDVQKPPKRRGPKTRRIRLWLTRPSTIRMAFTALRLIALVAKIINLF